MAGTVLLWAITQFIVTIVGSVILIQLGGWLPILTAILFILFYFIDGMVMMLLAAGYASMKSELKNKKEEEQ